MNRGMLVCCALLVVVSCASTVPPMAEKALEWESVAGEGVPTIVTRDPDGEERVTKLWLVVVDGQGLITTGDSRWFQNIQRDPNVVLRIGGYAYPLRAQLVTDQSLEERAKAAFREKYGWQDWLAGLFSGPDANLMRLVAPE